MNKFIGIFEKFCSKMVPAAFLMLTLIFVTLCFAGAICGPLFILRSWSHGPLAEFLHTLRSCVESDKEFLVLFTNLWVIPTLILGMIFIIGGGRTWWARGLEAKDKREGGCKGSVNGQP